MAALSAVAIEGIVLPLIFGGINFALQRRNLQGLTPEEQNEFLAQYEAESEAAAGTGSKALKDAIARYRERQGATGEPAEGEDGLGDSPDSGSEEAQA
jgi:hypothetical protein